MLRRSVNRLTGLVRDRPRGVVAGAVIAALAALGAWAGVAVVAAVDGSDPVAQRCADFTAAAYRRWSMSAAGPQGQTGIGPRVLVIGDSYSVGLGVEAGPSWPSRLPGQVLVDGFSGSGFSRYASECGDLSYASRAPHALSEAGDVDLVVVEGGLNDFDQPLADVTAGVRRVLREVAPLPVVVVGPAPAPSRVARMPEIDALLENAADAAGATYVSMLALDLPYLGDRLHLTVAGHDEFGDRVAGVVARVAARDAIEEETRR